MANWKGELLSSSKGSFLSRSLWEPKHWALLQQTYLREQLLPKYPLQINLFVRRVVLTLLQSCPKFWHCARWPESKIGSGWKPRRKCPWSLKALQRRRPWQDRDTRGQLDRLASSSTESWVLTLREHHKTVHDDTLLCVSSIWCNYTTSINQGQKA